MVFKKGGGGFSDYNKFSGAIKHYIKEMKEKKNDSMLEANIVPQIVIDENINQFCSYFCFISPAAAILDFKDGIKSTILEKPCCFKKFFVKREEQCTLNQLRGVLKYIRSVEGSIDFERKEDAILEAELFLVSLENS